MGSCNYKKIKKIKKVSKNYFNKIQRKIKKHITYK